MGGTRFSHARLRGPNTGRLLLSLALAACFLLGASVPALAAPPANDSFSSAQDLGSGSSASATGTNVEATKELGEPNHAGDQGGASVWYRWTAPSSGSVRVNTCGSDFDSVVAVYTGPSVVLLAPIASNDNFCGARSKISFDAVQGVEYRVAVDGKSSAGVPAQGTSRLSLMPNTPPANDNFSAALQLDSIPTVSASGHNFDATKEPGEANHGANPGGASVWFFWQPPETGDYEVQTCDSDFDTLLGVYYGSTVSTQAIVRGNDDRCGSGQSRLAFRAYEWQVYRIVVDGKRVGTTPAQGNYELTISPAQDVDGDGFADLEDNCSETPNPSQANNDNDGQGDACDADDDNDTVIDESDNCSMVFNPSQANTDADAQGDACDSDDDNDGVTDGSDACPLEHGTGPDGCAPPPGLANDDFGDAQSLGNGPSASATGTNVGATKEPGEPNHAGDAGGASVWYRWTAPSSGQFTIDTCGSDFDTLLAVYTGSTVGLLSPIASNDQGCDNQSRLTFIAAAGTTYRIAVDGWSDGGFDAPSQGSIELELASVTAPANDAFADAQNLGNGSTAAASATNVGATKEPSEPDHAGDPGGASVWYRWTAPSSGNFAIDTCGSNFDTLLGVYTGAVVGSLSTVADNDDGCDLQSGVIFGAAEGTTYRIAVDGWSGGFEPSLGSIELAIEPAEDQDGDGYLDVVDNCPTVPNPNQTDSDLDGDGDACDVDDDDDGLIDANDACPTEYAETGNGCPQAPIGPPAPTGSGPSPLPPQSSTSSPLAPKSSRCGAKAAKKSKCKKKRGKRKK